MYSERYKVITSKDSKQKKQLFSVFYNDKEYVYGIANLINEEKVSLEHLVFVDAESRNNIYHSYLRYCILLSVMEHYHVNQMDIEIKLEQEKRFSILNAYTTKVNVLKKSYVIEIEKIILKAIIYSIFNKIFTDSVFAAI